jgi:uncharacterized protein YigE (DUF2233 family)
MNLPPANFVRCTPRIFRVRHLAMGFAIAATIADAKQAWSQQSNRASVPVNPMSCSKKILKGSSFRVCELRQETKAKLQIFARDAYGRPLQSIRRADSLVSARGETLVFATNGGIFERVDSASGLLIAEGKQYSPLDTTRLQSDCANNFHCEPNAVFFSTARGLGKVLSTEDFVRWRHQHPHTSLKFATQSGPMLVRKGRLARRFSSNVRFKKLRTGVGIRTDGSIVFAAADSITPLDFATVFMDELHATDAMFLDGVISEFYVLGDAIPGEQNFASILGVTSSRSAGPESAH